jgi:hypothetical protein
VEFLRGLGRMTKMKVAVTLEAALRRLGLIRSGGLSLLVFWLVACADDTLPPPTRVPPTATVPALTATPDPAAAPCQSWQLKGDSATRLYYPRQHPGYRDVRGSVVCFDSHGHAQSSGYRLAPP